MRWVSMVPSWTETLLECGAQVVGRTRYCIHPQEKIKSIAVVGGTKDLNLESLRAVDCDLLLLDREENPKAMAEPAEKLTFKIHATHVRSILDLPIELKALAEMASAHNDLSVSLKLTSLAERWERVAEASLKRKHAIMAWENLPGVIRWLTPPPHQDKPCGSTEIVYVIWRSPWMLASEGTFISSVLHAVGFGPQAIFSPIVQNQQNLYPAFEMKDVPAGSVVFLSSEPYPFVTRSQSVMSEIGELAESRQLSVALVNGESFSWFGSRSLEFLENALNLPRFGKTIESSSSPTRLDPKNS